MTVLMAVRIFGDGHPIASSNNEILTLCLLLIFENHIAAIHFSVHLLFPKAIGLN